MNDDEHILDDVRQIRGRTAEGPDPAGHVGVTRVVDGDEVTPINRDPAPEHGGRRRRWTRDRSARADVFSNGILPDCHSSPGAWDELPRGLFILHERIGESSLHAPEMRTISRCFRLTPRQRRTMYQL